MPMTLIGSVAASDEQQQQQSVIEIPNAVQRALTILNKVHTDFPGLLVPYIELARCHISLGKFDDALKMLRKLLQMQPHCISALLMVAKVEVSRCNTTAADRSLEQALFADFSVRTVPLFKLIQVAIRSQQGRSDEAMKDAEALMTLPEVRTPIPEESPGRMHTDSMRLTDDDRVVAYISHAVQLSKSKRLKEANKILSEAKLIFAGTHQEVQVLVASSQLAVERKDFDAAIRMLDKIKEDSPTFTRAILIKADILLIHMRDKEGFTKCFKKLVEVEESPKNYSLLGDAYLRILNPEEAVVALKCAYKIDENNSKLRTKIGKALIATHDYHHAIDFYEQALKHTSSHVNMGVDISTESVALSHDLGKLYLKLGRLESARRVLERALHRQHKEVLYLQQDVTTLRLLSDVLIIHNPSEVLDTLKRARELQKDVVDQTRAVLSQTSSAVEQERKTLADICEIIGAWYMEKREGKDPNALVEAAAFFSEAIQHNPQNTLAMFGLAKLHNLKNETELCLSQCKKLLLADPGDQNAAAMYSDLLYREKQVEEAVAPLQLLLESHPNNYYALERIIILLRRIGRLAEVPTYLKAAEKADKRSSSHAGLRFCQGLYSRYTNDVISAIKEFNLSRRDATWGQDAIIHMIELFLNPDQDGVWEERDTTETALADATNSHIAIAESLLKELKPIARDLRRYEVLENYWLLSTRIKANSDKAMQSFIHMLETDNDYLPAVLGMATGFMMEKNQVH